MVLDNTGKKSDSRSFLSHAIQRCHLTMMEPTSF